MRIKSILKKGAKVQHGWSYLDPVEAKPRQFDLRARMEHHDWAMRISMAVEGKNIAPEAPLVISGSARTRDEAFHHFITSDTSEDSIRIMKVWRDQLIYPVQGFVGRSAQRFRSNDKGALVPMGDGEAFKAWSQALASADELCKEAAVAKERGGGPVRTVVIPIVVVPDRALWTVEYDDAGQSKGPPKQVDQTTLFLNHGVSLAPNSSRVRLGHVHILTLEGLEAFIAPLAARRADWDDWFPASAEVQAPHGL